MCITGSSIGAIEVDSPLKITRADVAALMSDNCVVCW